MLKMMRSSFQHLKWILILVIFLFVLLIFVDWGGGGQAGSASEAYAAKVNGDVIPVRDFTRSLYYMEQNYEQSYGQALTPEMRKAMGLERQVMNSLVEQKLLLEEAERLGLSATAEEIRQEILQIPVLSPNGKFVGGELYERYVTGNLGYASAAEFEEELARGVTIRKIESALLSAVVIPPQTAEMEFRRRNESAKVRYILYPIDKTLQTVAVTPAEIESHYAKNGSTYSHPEQRNAKYLLADMATIRSQIQIPESELKAEYEKRKESYKRGESVRAQHILIKFDSTSTPEQVAAARTKADSLLAKLRAGGDFAKLARENSDDPGSGALGGDVGFFEKGRMVPEFEQSAFSMPIGQISDLVKSQFGYHIIRVNEKSAGGYRSFEEVRPELTSVLTSERATSQARERINRVRDSIQQSKAKTDEELRKLTDSVISYNDGLWFGKTEKVAGLERAPEVNAWAFLAKTGDVGPVMETSRGPIVPVLVGVRPVGVSPLAEVRARVENDVKTAKAREAARQALAGALKGANVNQAAATLGLTPVEAEITREGRISGLTGNVQALATAAVNAKKGETKGPVVIDQGAVAFDVVEVKGFDRVEFEKQKSSLIGMVRQREAQKLRSTLLDGLRRQAKVEMNPQVMGEPSPAAP